MFGLRHSLFQFSEHVDTWLRIGPHDYYGLGYGLRRTDALRLGVNEKGLFPPLGVAELKLVTSDSKA